LRLRLDAMAAVVCPGDRLRHSSEVVAGRGTYVRESDGAVCAALAGAAVVTPALAGAADARPVVEVLRGSAAAPLPQPGATVLARVTRVTPRMASCDILCVAGAATEAPFSGIIRQQDVRATEVDKVALHDCFRPGDVVRASVLSLGDARSYYLTTARNELGVVHARSAAAGEPLAPRSWQEMVCPKTQTVEKRKVARVAV
jgi:exosome complex RNA-binding protein Csl4